jgi:hypothetical protein
MTEIARDESSIELQAESAHAAWLRMMAVLYDPFLWLGESQACGAGGARYWLKRTGASSKSAPGPG